MRRAGPGGYVTAPRADHLVRHPGREHRGKLAIGPPARVRRRRQSDSDVAACAKILDGSRWFSANQKTDMSTKKVNIRVWARKYSNN